MPWLHEGFHASWHKNKMPEFSERWFVKLPVVSEGKVLGRIEAFGHHQNASTYVVITALSEMLEELQPGIQSITQDFKELSTTAKQGAHKSQLKSDSEKEVDSPLPFEVGHMQAANSSLG
jgi:UDP-GlcNAc:undecaprenyl-phosphate GlcNAc-1-phosphate transferase